MSKFKSRLPTLIGVGLMLLLVAGLIYMIKGFIDGAEKPSKNKVQQISLVRPPPPKPPEEKPPEEKPPEPEKLEVPREQPIPQANNQPPPDQPLGSTLGPGNDGFGLPPGSGGTRIGGGGGSRARWYAGLLGSRIEQALNRDTKLLNELKAKRIMVRIWIGNTGHVERVEWDKGAVPGNAEQTLREQLLALTVQESPDGIEQPIWYRFRPRG